MSEPVTIVGGGLAGCALAWALRERGCEVRLVDRDEPETSSKVAAGIINPITGPKLTLTWRFAELWPAALDFYAAVEAQCRDRLFRRVPLLRLFKDDEQARRWRRRLAEPGYAERVDDGEVRASPGLHAEHGGFQTGHAGFLDVPAFIAATRAMLGEQWRVGEGGAGGGTTIFCEGAAGRGNPLFGAVRFKPAKGEILDLRIPGLDAGRIVNRGGVWLLPLGGDRFRAGSTYDWERADTEPTAAGRAEIEARLDRLLELPWEVTGQRAAVRPVIRASRVMLGMHPERPRIGFFNGLGSKGVLGAPLFARQFAAAICGGGAIDPEVDLRNHL